MMRHTECLTITVGCYNGIAAGRNVKENVRIYKKKKILTETNRQMKIMFELLGNVF